MRQTLSRSGTKTRRPSEASKDRPDRGTKFVVIALSLAIANLRPTAIGGTYSFQVCCAILFLLTALVFRAERGRLRVDLEPQLATQLGIFVLIVCYVFVRSAFSLYFHSEDSPKAFLISVAFLMVLLVVMSIRSITTLFFDTFAFTVIASAASLIATFSLLAAGWPVTSLVLFKIDLATYRADFGNIAFPFTVVANEISGWFGSMPRLSGIFREPGIFPPFACWAATYAFLRGWRGIFVIIPLVASLLSFSTIGTLSFFTGAMLILYRFHFRPLAAFLTILAVGIFIWPALYTIEYIGLEAKISSQSGSFAERYILISEAFNVENLWFGDGFGWGNLASAEGISLLSQLRVYGVFYFVCVITLYLVTCRNMRLWIPGCLPAVVAVFFSQPIAVEPAFLMIFFSWSALRVPSGGPDARRMQSSRLDRYSTPSTPPSIKTIPTA
ncbi:hypothetical protein BCCGELA001_28125 [Bradyrhizobium sp. CCGE-LA001]|nr:hypothetical protein BCCGELA001_28125 [Bradyrhizobium sp. CCGE-LA001]